MKQYKEIEAKVYGDDEIQGRYFEIVTHKNVIVLTLEEAHDLWSAGHKRGWAECLHGEEESGRPNFVTYLKSKGMQL